MTFVDYAAGPPVVGGNSFAATNDWYLVRRNTRTSTQARNVVQILWRPSVLGIFRYKGILGAGKYKLSLNPEPNYQKTCVEMPYGVATGYGALDETKMNTQLLSATSSSTCAWAR